MRDLQSRVPEGPESADAPEEAQGAVEAAEEGEPGGAEEGFRVPRADVPPPRSLPRSRRPRRNQEALSPQTQQPQAVGLPQVLQGLRRSV